MKKTFLLTTFVLILSLSYVQAQNSDNNAKDNTSGLALSVGGSANYYYGLGDRNFDKFENDRLNWQLNGLLGITVARDKGGRRTMLTAFGAYGFNNKFTMSQLLKDQGYVTLATDQSGANNFYQLEGGILIAEVLRISTGVGQQNFNEQILVSSDGVQLNTKYLKYNSSTIGFNLNLGSITWTINCNFAYGKDFDKTVLMPNSGLMLRF